MASFKVTSKYFFCANFNEKIYVADRDKEIQDFLENNSENSYFRISGIFKTDNKNNLSAKNINKEKKIKKGMVVPQYFFSIQTMLE